MTAAIYAARKRIDFVMVTQDIGGQTAWSGDVENYTGYQFISGLELAKKFEEHLKQFNIDLRINEDVVRVKKTAQGFLTETKKATFESRSVLIASGRRARLLNVPGEEAFKNRGVTYCATCDGPIFANKTVAVIGGGNSALDATLQLIRIAEKIYLIDAAPKLRADAIMCQKALSSSNVEVLHRAVVKEIYGRQFVEGIKLNVDGSFRDLPLKGVFIEIGSTPNSDIIDFVDKDANGEILVDQSNATSALGVFAAGDVTNIPEKQIIVAAGEGAKAVLAIFKYLMARF